MKCNICTNEIKVSKKNSALFNGFLDADTFQHVCFKCQDNHYKIKFSNIEFRGLYSEIPITLPICK